MEKIAIIGANGQIGHELIKTLKDQYELFSFTHENLKIEDYNSVNKLLTEIKPNFVINTAAYHNLALCEENPQIAFLVNATAVKYLVEICNKIDSTLIHFSTSYVFGMDNQRDHPYNELDVPGPVQMYGISKLAGELIIKLYSNKYYCLRTAGVYGIKGAKSKEYPNFVEMMIKLGKEAEMKNEILHVSMDQILTFTSASDISRAVKKLIEKDAYGLYHLTCEGFCSRLEFANTIFELSNIKVKTMGVNSDFFQMKYKQPKYSVLNNLKLNNLGIYLPNWKESLKEYLKIRNQQN